MLLLLQFYLVVGIVIFLILSQFSVSQPQQAGNQNVKPPIVSETIDRNKGLFFRAIVLSVPADCDAILDYYKENALKRVGAYGLDAPHYTIGAIDDVMPDIAATTESNTKSSQVADRSATYTTTNVQVQGVDEADIVKTDGKYIYVVYDNIIRVVDVQQTKPKVLSETELDFFPTDMLLSTKSGDNPDLQ